MVNQALPAVDHVARSADQVRLEADAPHRNRAEVNESPPARDVTVLMATCNGARHLEAQLNSIAAQRDWGRIDVVTSDDGSSDATLKLLQQAAETWRRGTFEITHGPRQGFSENFRSLLLRPLQSSFVAFCDQDDVWLPSKLAVAAIAIGNSGQPTLYCGRTLLVDEAGRVVGHSPLFRGAPGFANALVQSIAGANTMVMNRAATELVREAAARGGFVSHDWFCYQIVSGAGGRVIYDPVPQIRYRQHDANLVGANTGWTARLDRLRRAWGGRFVEWNDKNLATLSAAADLLTPQAQQRLRDFDSARHGNVLARLSNLKRSGVWRQTPGGQISLWAAALLNKL